MNKKNIWAFMFAAGLLIGGLSWYYSEAPVWDDTKRFSEHFFWATVVPVTTGGMILGGAMIVVGLAIGYLTGWGKNKNQ